MTQPKTYNGKFNRVKNLIDNSYNVKSAVEAFAKSNPDQETFYNLHRLVYLEIKEALEQKGQSTQGNPTSGKSKKSAEHMAFTLSSWLQTELFPETRQPSLMNDTKFFRATQNGTSMLEFSAQQENDPHQSIKYAEGNIQDKLGVGLRSREERFRPIQQSLTA